MLPINICRRKFAGLRKRLSNSAENAEEPLPATVLAESFPRTVAYCAAIERPLIGTDWVTQALIRLSASGRERPKAALLL